MKEEAVNRLGLFFKEMTIWENDANKIAHLLRSDPIHEPLRERLAELQKEYCTPGAKCRAYSVELPPTYSQMIVESCEEVGKGKISIRVRDDRGGLGEQYIFIVIFKNEKWMLSERIFVNCEGKKRQFYF